MSNGGDIFDPQRLKKLWERPEEDEFDARERAEEDLAEREPAEEALELYEEIVLSCRRRLGTDVRPLLAVLDRGRELLAAKIAADRKTAAPAAPETPAEAEVAPVKKDEAVPEGQPMSKSEAESRRAMSGVASSDERVDRKLAEIFEKAKVYTGIDLDEETAAAVPSELGAVLDAIEDLFGVLEAGKG